MPVTEPQAAICNYNLQCRASLCAGSQAVEKTGLGVRIANLCISVLGKTSLGLAYGLACAELVLSPAMPSTTARAGGVFVSPFSCASLS